jgi:CheY-like chemotaxis protein
MAAKKILMAEDDSGDIELALLALDEDHLANEVVVVRNGVEALDYLYRRGAYCDYVPGNPRVVILDVKMPKVGGMEVLRQIKLDPKLQGIPVVMLTSSKEERDLVESYHLGVNAYCVKPVTFEKYVALVRELCLFWVMTNEVPPH